MTCKECERFKKTNMQMLYALTGEWIIHSVGNVQCPECGQVYGKTKSNPLARL